MLFAMDVIEIMLEISVRTSLSGWIRMPGCGSCRCRDWLWMSILTQITSKRHKNGIVLASFTALYLEQLFKKCQAKYLLICVIQQLWTLSKGHGRKPPRMQQEPFFNLMTFVFLFKLSHCWLESVSLWFISLPLQETLCHNLENAFD